ncbi:MAG TPA: NAD(P)/FAD-dependent oxidoreductase, partial [Solirubrobacteraceae bacterium]
EGIRTALYFGLACGRELRGVHEGHSTRENALRRYGSFSDAHAWKFRSLLGVQRLVGQLTPTRAITVLTRALEQRRISDWAFEHYLRIAPPSFVNGESRPSAGRARLRAPATA